MTERLSEALSALADEMGVSQQNPGREAYFQGVADGEVQGPELSSGMSYDDVEVQYDYDIGTYVGAAIWASKLKLRRGGVK